jgi:ABC-type nitrate/sulfonate/bicarbonate transport system substrate-binding protein
VRYVPVLLLLVPLLLGCPERRDAPASRAPLQPFEVTLDWAPSPEFFGFYYAKAKGIYAKRGLDVRLHHGAGAPAVAADLGSGAIYAGTTTSDNLVRQIARGGRFSRAVALLAYNPVVIASLEGSGIAEPRDLRGHTLGTNRNSSTYQQLRFLLNREQIDAATFREYPIEFGGAAELLDRRVDAVLAYRANVVAALEAKGKKAREIFLSGHGIYTYGEVLAFADRAALEAAGIAPAAVDAFADATLEGYRRCAEDVGACVAALTDADPPLNPEKLSHGIRQIMRLTPMAAYPRSELDRWVVAGAVTEEHRTAALALYGESQERRP